MAMASFDDIYASKPQPFSLHTLYRIWSGVVKKSYVYNTLIGILVLSGLFLFLFSGSSSKSSSALRSSSVPPNLPPSFARLASLLVDIHKEASSTSSSDGDDDNVLRFFSIGDFGVNTAGARTAALALANVTASLRPSFIVGLGDNFYPTGVEKHSAQRQFRQNFESVYGAQALRSVPWFMALGDHDHCGDVGAQVQYTASSSNKRRRWRMPAQWFGVRANARGEAAESGTNAYDAMKNAAVQFVFSDTVAGEGSMPGVEDGDGSTRRHMYDRCYRPDAAGRAVSEEHNAYVERELERWSSGADGAAPWMIVVGHRPVLSATRRSCAPPNEGGLSAAEMLHRDYRIRKYADHSERAQRADRPPLVYLGGHDHTVQHIESRGASSSVHFLVNGVGGYDLHAFDKRCEAGASASCLPLGAVGHEHKLHVASAYYGFAVHELRASRFDTIFVDAEGLGRDVRTTVFRKNV
ncbi:tartrate-resistant acid phosphatase type 5 [Pycnococcus provasolii]